MTEDPGFCYEITMYNDDFSEPFLTGKCKYCDMRNNYCGFHDADISYLRRGVPNGFPRFDPRYPPLLPGGTCDKYEEYVTGDPIELIVFGPGNTFIVP